MKRVFVVTGASGFLGKQLLLELACRTPARHIFALVGNSEPESVLAWLRSRNVVPAHLTVLSTQLQADHCGVPMEAFREFRDCEIHVIHCAAHYDLDQDDWNKCFDTNVTGTANAIALARRIGAASFNLISTIAVAGEYPGVWTESHFREAKKWSNNYGRTKHQAEGLIREAQFPAANIFRLGVLVGDTQTGSYFKADGIYKFFPALNGALRYLPSGMPLPSIGWANIPICPVDHAARVIASLVAQANTGLAVHHVFEDTSYSVDDILEIFIKSADHDGFVVPTGSSHILTWLSEFTRHDRVLDRLKNELLDALGELDVPTNLLKELRQPTQFVNKETSRRLCSMGIASPELPDYAPRLWRAWQAGRTIQRRHQTTTHFENKNVLLTGGTSGIGKAIARKLVRRKANIVVLARNRDAFEKLRASLGSPGAERLRFIECDLLNDVAISEALTELSRGKWIPDVFIHAAGLSVAREFLKMSAQAEETKRMTQVNFLSAVTLLRSLLPGMIERGGGHVVALSSISSEMDVAEYASYSASKTALDQFFTALRAELLGKGILFGILHLPLVKSPMTSRNIKLRNFPMMSEDAAASRVIEAILAGRFRTSMPYGKVFAVIKSMFPKGSLVLSTITWRIVARFPYFAKLLDATFDAPAR
ncbi:NAD(P)-dependent dehydrogenase (short-subunit alcohol dehydrogenase family) [Bradyrhizobium sp. USDA 4524]|uniref:SDR family NAD(P)-dependent oxidoreductase n=1 Tax=unclassified Bradyrhizobium TaxID=2631580 RepID=UPI0020A0D142|nr:MULTISPECIES: SDR family NAD(P)-dependent oxidoreductase [unclassified Bradyrhizobium]MCP1845981.1 NAD(P)-dependent dehydrogenase (short-subunit alcohol dehydrogenase family) [Bradyrhizobium sp. USDA 4538]MCP1907385.1 NAD(P)-dependent dehydrogenase (short-subunit alcohol dehydrogenase family) [Bradyrhizobium sp. USDA 4537]MCP1985171.1 NAD(P)-dependent dehydrogenase (short-subunit alcohol dehydrogenase family) [Bradyrhizobium sp. USDA 4539]